MIIPAGLAPLDFRALEAAGCPLGATPQQHDDVLLLAERETSAPAFAAAMARDMPRHAAVFCTGGSAADLARWLAHPRVRHAGIGPAFPAAIWARLLTGRPHPVDTALDLPNPDAIAPALALTRSHARRAGLAHRGVLTAVGIVDELLANAFRHGAAPTELRLGRDEASVILSVRDAGGRLGVDAVRRAAVTVHSGGRVGARPPPESAGVGLHQVLRAAARLQLRAGPGATEITAWVAPAARRSGAAEVHLGPPLGCTGPDSE